MFTFSEFELDNHPVSNAPAGSNELTIFRIAVDRSNVLSRIWESHLPEHFRRKQRIREKEKTICKQARKRQF
jgi:hypothetical protein